MKVALIFLSFFVAASYQQGYYPYWPFYQPFYQPYYAPLSYQIAQPSGQSRLNSDAEAREGDEGVKVSPSVTDAMARGNSLIFTLGGLFPSATSYTTKTSWTTVSSTATTATVVTCIPKSYFSSSTGCRRRRAIFEDSGLDPELLAPSPKDEVVPSVAAEEVKREAEPEILSSQDEIDSDPLHNIRKRYVTTVSTITVVSTSTSYSFTVTTYTKTLTIGSTTSVLICLPSGINVC